MGLNNKTVLVTGAAGSVGSQIVEGLIKTKVRRIIALDNAENELFQLQSHLKESKKNLESVNFILGDVTKAWCVQRIFKEYSPNIVIHAAAYKHVSMVESNPLTSFEVNVIGFKVIYQLSRLNQVERFVFISTDKAVEPQGMMGRQKRLCELFILRETNCYPSNMVSVVLRLGNVINSRGSLLPIIKKRLNEGLNIEITDFNAKRFFIEPEKVIDSILFALTLRNTTIVIPDMGEIQSVHQFILDYSREIMQDKYFKPKFKEIGLRYGEKKIESLHYKSEKLKSHKGHYLVNELKEPDLDWWMVFRKLMANYKGWDQHNVVSTVKFLVDSYKFV